MVKISCLFVALLFGIFTNQGFAQLPEALVQIDTNDVLIGDRVNIKLNFSNPKKVHVVWPFVADTIGHLEILKSSEIDTIQSGNGFSLSRVYTVTGFDAGTFSVPSFTFGYEKQKGEQEIILTQPVEIRFHTMEVDTTAEIKDIKGPLDEPVSWMEYLFYLIIAVLIIIASIFAYRYWIKRKSKFDDVLDYDPSIPPHILALEALKQLEQERLWQSGQVKKYYIRLTDIIRTYMRRQFGINAMEMITTEIIAAMKQYGFKDEFIKNMTFVFETADFAKFAKHQPLPDENAKCMKLAVEFVNETIKLIKETPLIGNENTEQEKHHGEQIADLDKNDENISKDAK